MPQPVTSQSVAFRRVKRAMRQTRTLYYSSGISPEKTLLARLGIVLGLLAIAIAFFWFERAGLKDQVDGHVSFSDIIYFTMITITSVGYGDIVPVSDSARLTDAIAVTPIRIFIWLIFLGTAYEFILQKIVEDFRMSRLQKNLKDHVVLCGFGHSGLIVAQESIAKGMPPEKIVAIDGHEERVRLAAETGLIGLLGDATSEELLTKACLDTAKAVIVSTGRDDTTILVILTLRHLAPKVRVLASIKQEENVKLARLSGADLVVSPPRIGGYLLANGVETEQATPFLSDLMSMGGNITLGERRANPDEVGKIMAEVATGLVVQVRCANGHEVPFGERGRYVIQGGDTLLLINAA